MFGHQERVAILLLIAVALAVIAAHVVLVQIGKAPFASAYSDQSADGALVSLTGIIDQATVLKNGGHVLLTVRNVTVFIPANVAGNGRLRRVLLFCCTGPSRLTREKKRFSSVQRMISGRFSKLSGSGSGAGVPVSSIRILSGPPYSTGDNDYSYGSDHAGPHSPGSGIAGKKDYLMISSVTEKFRTV